MTYWLSIVWLTIEGERKMKQERERVIFIWSHQKLILELGRKWGKGGIEVKWLKGPSTYICLPPNDLFYLYICRSDYSQQILFVESMKHEPMSRRKMKNIEIRQGQGQGQVILLEAINFYSFGVLSWINLSNHIIIIFVIYIKWMNKEKSNNIVSVVC